MPWMPANTVAMVGRMESTTLRRVALIALLVAVWAVVVVVLGFLLFGGGDEEAAGTTTTTEETTTTTEETTTTHTLIATSGNLTENQWHHVAAVYDGDTMILYYNGTPVGTRTKTGTIATNPNIPVWIGGNPSGATHRPWHGSLDELAIYNQALTPQQIQTLAAGRTNSDPVSVAHWPMGEGSGTTAADVSPNGYDATLINGPTWADGGIAFDGIDDYLDAGGIDVTGTAITITAWFNATELTHCRDWDCRIISKATGVDEQDHTFMISTIRSGANTRLRFRLKTTTTAAETTTTAAETTRSAGSAAVVAATTAIGVLEPYSDGGAELFPPGSVEAHWYQWDGSYVVLYRGWDAASAASRQGICAGASILPPSGPPWLFVTNSPYRGDAEAICVNAAKIDPFGVQSCGPLLYYLTEIPIDEEGTLFGTLEIGDASGFNGQTSEAPADPEVPQFEPNRAAYELPPADVDSLGTVTCEE